MQPKLNRFILLFSMAVSGLSAMGQVSNGDFSNGTNGWSYFFPPGNHFPPDYGIWNIDIDGPGPLGIAIYDVALTPGQVKARFDATPKLH